MRFSFLISCLFFESSSVAKGAKTYFGDREKGWFWYEAKPQKKEAPKEKATKSGVKRELTPREQLKKQGDEWENALAQAVLSPSEENIREYLSKMAEINTQALDFAKGFKRTIWVNPRYDFRLSQRPVTTQAIIAHNERQNFALNQALKVIAESKGIIFFFKSACPHCQRFAPIVKKFSDSHGFSVVPVSLDNKGLPAYPNPQKDFQISARLDVSVVPAIFLVDPDRNEVAACSYGFTDVSTLSQKVIVAAKQMEKTRSR